MFGEMRTSETNKMINRTQYDVIMSICEQGRVGALWGAAARYFAKTFDPSASTWSYDAQVAGDEVSAGGV